MKVPSVTTIISRFKDSGGLIWWSWNLAFKPLTEARQLLFALASEKRSPALILAAKKFLEIPMSEFDYQAVRDEAGDTGTAAHKLVECHIRSHPVALKGCDRSVKAAYTSYQAWVKQTKLKPEKAEIRLVSEEHQFAGCMDSIIIEGERNTMDWKTSNKVYPDMLMQLAAYRGMWNENFPKKPIHSAYLIKFGKDPEYPSFDQKHFTRPQLDLGYKAFLVLRQAYDLVKQVEKSF